MFWETFYRGITVNFLFLVSLQPQYFSFFIRDRGTFPRTNATTGGIPQVATYSSEVHTRSAM